MINFFCFYPKTIPTIDMTNKKISKCLPLASIVFLSFLTDPKPIYADYKCVPYFSARKQIEKVWSMSVRGFVLPQMPERFNSGCTYVDTGASTINVFVFTNGIELNGKKENVLLGTLIPKVMLSDNVRNDDKLATLYTICTSNGNYKYCLNKPKDRAYQDYYNGKLSTCFRNICLQSPSISSSEQLEIMNSLRGRKK